MKKGGEPFMQAIDPTRGRTAIFIGSSVCEGCGATPGKGWAALAAQRLARNGWTSFNCAIGGPMAVILGVVGSIISQMGDLSFSVIKREFGVKDYGKLLPGHGGILDRFDSVTFVSPCVWLLLTMWILR